MPPEDTDPRCPDCDGPVSATAPYCLHCGADLESEGTGQRRGGNSNRNRAPSERAVQTTSSETGDAEAAANDHLFDPDGLLDNSLTVLVGIVGGALVGALAFLLFGLVVQSWVSILPGGLAWTGGTAYLATRDSIGEAVKYGCYAVALLLVLFPVVSFSPATKGGNFAGRVLLFLVAELLFGVFALGLAGVGHVAGKR
ncbi:hypothetical protein [Halorussus salinisoli]|uniref:hypothetical protein n=1 Tax=Halorussus salinisoli TaxID=2558242 RepID=UPI0010C1F10D|nr:hypothetical protein [Halorussus salinisoli]